MHGSTNNNNYSAQNKCKLIFQIASKQKIYAHNVPYCLAKPSLVASLVLHCSYEANLANR